MSVKVEIFRNLSEGAQTPSDVAEVADSTLRVLLYMSPDKSDPLNQIGTVGLRAGNFGMKATLDLTKDGHSDWIKSEIERAMAALIVVALDVAPEIRDAIAAAAARRNR